MLNNDTHLKVCGIQWISRLAPFVALILLALTLSAVQVAEPSSRVHPALAALAAQDPARPVTIIVQKRVGDSSVEAHVAELGGSVTKNLSIINAFAAELPAHAVPELARADGVRWVSLDAPVEKAGKGGGGDSSSTPPQNYYLDTTRTRQVWQMGLQGQGITVAVIDSGVSKNTDFAVPGNSSASRVIRQMSFNPNSRTVNDAYGHGTHVAGIIGGNGTDSSGALSGAAQQVNLISLKISDDTGMAYESDTVAAMQWVLDNKATYNIRVANLSVNSAVEQSYHTSPLDAAAEILWFNGVVVVVSAGNKGPAGGYNTANAAPANDPFVITVGASDEKGTSRLTDDIVTPYSSYGTTTDGFVKPDLIAPGTSIYSVLSRNSPWGTQYPDRVAYNGEYFRLSGTSMAAPVVSGAVALLLQDEPNLTPDQVKYRLLHTTSRSLSVGNGSNTITFPYLDVHAAVTGTTTQSANTGLVASQMLWTGSTPVTWGSVNWNSVNWNSVNWNSVNWNSVNWNSLNWNSTYWGP